MKKLNAPIKIDVDDKTSVILCATIIAVLCIFFLPDPHTIISNAMTGLFGVAVGRALDDSTNKPI